MPDPLHEPGGPTVAWSTINTAENFPGVATPLGWTFWRDGIELGVKGGFADIGVLRPDEVEVAASPDDRIATAFYGRFSGNIDQLRALSDRMPGTSGSETELQIFGSVRPEVQDQPSRRRYPVIAVKMPRTFRRLPTTLERMRSDVEPWWRGCTAPAALGTPERASAVLLEASGRFAQAMRLQTIATFAASALYAQLNKLAIASGNPGLETAFMSGYGGMEETRTMGDLWRLSRGEISLDRFLEQHGYHAPVESEVRSRSWREDPDPVIRRAEAYAPKPESASPRALEDRQRAARRAAEQRLLASLPRVRRPLARILLRQAGRYVPLREAAKAMSLRSIDVGRAAARALGPLLVERGRLQDPDDIYFLTVVEAAAPLPDATAALVTARRAAFQSYESVRLPTRWIGNPEPQGEEIAPDPSAVLSGIAVSPGVVEGVARVMSGADDGELDDGEILVCHTTDPSWAPLFLLASALVVDIGGAMSHCALVAREIGLPCVINTGDGTKVINTGDRIRVDGDAGTVEVLQTPTISSKGRTPELRLHLPGEPSAATAD